MPTQQKCALCDRQFTRAEHLARHIRSHTKQKPFPCLVCGKAYVREDTLMRHARSHRTDGKSSHRDDSTTQLPESQIPPDGGHSATQVLSSGPLSVPAPMAMPQDLADQDAVVQPMDLTMANIFTNDNIQRVDFDAIFGPMTESWEFGDSSMVDMFDVGATRNEYWLDSAHSALEPGSNQSRQSLRISKDRNTSTTVTQAGANMGLPNMDLRKLWFTRLASPEGDLPILRPLSPDQSPIASVSDATDISDHYRLRLSKTVLSPLPPDDPLPSSDFLNQCVRMYFNHFNPLFPALHYSTFRPTPDNGLLLLSIASIGCLFIGSPAAVRQGKQIFARVNKAVLTSWHAVLSRSSNEVLAMLQASVLGQTFALLSGEPKLIATFDVFHSSLCSLARRAGMLDSIPASLNLRVSETSDLERKWRTWARREEIDRMHACLIIHDAEMSALLHREPLTGLNIDGLPRLSTTRMFLATTALEWATITENELNIESDIDDRPERSFSGYVALERLGSSIAEDRRRGRLNETTTANYHGALMDWYNRYGRFVSNGESDQFCVMILWHWTYMSLLVDFDQLERAIGRDDHEATKSAISYVTSWIESPDSTRCVLHGFALQKQLESMTFGQVLAIHVPRITFAAAIAWHCYLQHGPPDDISDIWEEIDVHFPEFASLDLRTTNALTSLRSKWDETSMMKAATLCKLGIMLQRMVHWGIAERFGDIVSFLIHN